MIRFGIYEADLARVKPGAPVQVKVIAYPDRSFPGRIEWMSSVMDPVTRTARLRCPLANPDRALLPGQHPAGHLVHRLAVCSHALKQQTWSQTLQPSDRW